MDRIKKIIERLVKKTQTNNPVEICHLLGIDILYLDLGNIGGFKTSVSRSSVIYVNSTLPEFDQKFIIAHELGHIVLHKGIKTPFFRYFQKQSILSKIESEANIFAIILLLDKFCNDDSFMNLSSQRLIDSIGLPQNLEYLFSDVYQQLNCYF